MKQAMRSELHGCLRAVFGSTRAAVALGGSAALVLAVAMAAQPPGSRLKDVLDEPSRVVAAPQRGVVTGIAGQSAKLVAVGPRGLILQSTDGATTWRQVVSPVSSDLVSVRFTGPDLVWATGHDAVLLRSTDGGSTWQRMLDGRAVLALLRKAYNGPDTQQIQKEIERTTEQSAVPDVWPAPFLDIRFTDADHGFAVGGFGLIVHTADGGRSWEPWIDRADNERRFHLNAMGGEGADLYVVGEQGLLLRLDAALRRFVQVATPYNGTFFGVDALGARLVVYGLRGNAFVSNDGGAQWRKIDTGTDANLVAALESNGRLLLVTQSGQMLVTDFDGGSTKLQPVAAASELYGAVLLGANRLAVAGLGGVTAVSWPVATP